MGFICWKDGVEKVDRHELRQFPERHVWSSTLWCTRRGTVLRRYFNPVDRTFVFSSEPIELAMEESGRIGLHLTGRFVPIETIICSAWRTRKMNSSAPVQRVGPRREIAARYLRWGEEEGAEVEQRPLEEEIWAPLRYMCGIVSCDGRGYWISNTGRLRNPGGHITRGFAFAGSRYAAAKGCGLVDLYVAAGIHDAPEVQPPCIRNALNALMSGDGPDAVRPVTNATLKSVWCYFSRAVEWADPSDLKMVWTRLVPDELVRVLKRLKREADPLWGGSLTNLMPIVSERLPAHSDFHSDDLRFEKLRFARACITATARP